MSNRVDAMEESVAKAMDEDKERPHTDKELFERRMEAFGGRELRRKIQGWGWKWRNNPCRLRRRMRMSSATIAAHCLLPVSRRRSPGLYMTLSMR